MDLLFRANASIIAKPIPTGGMARIMKSVICHSGHARAGLTNPIYVAQEKLTGGIFDACYGVGPMPGLREGKHHGKGH